MADLIFNNLHSSTGGAVPATLDAGQIAINNTDEILYIKGKDSVVPIYAGKWNKAPEQIIEITGTEEDEIQPNADGIYVINPTSPNVVVLASKEITKILIEPTEAEKTLGKDIEYNVWLSNCLPLTDETLARVAAFNNGYSSVEEMLQDNDFDTIEAWLDDQGYATLAEYLDDNSYLPQDNSIVIDAFGTKEISGATIYRYSIEKDVFVHARYCSRHNATMYSHANAEFKAEELDKAARVVLYNETEKKWLTVDGTVENLTRQNGNGYTPIGIEVIPEGFNLKRDYSVFDIFNTVDTVTGRTWEHGKTIVTSKPVMMSLKAMNYTTPDVGGVEQSMYWGYYSQNDDGIVTNDLKTKTSAYYIPMDKYKYSPLSYSEDVPFTQNDASKYMHSSPFKLERFGNLVQNPNYGWEDKETCSTLDYDGYMHTQKIWDAVTVANWKTSTSEISNSSSKGNYPAAMCCYRYHTEGTKQGSWYLPAQGELIYILPFFNRINKAIDNINAVFGQDTAVPLSAGNYYWSSSEYSSGGAFGVGTGYGRVGTTDTKYYTNCVRAFCPVG